MNDNEQSNGDEQNSSTTNEGAGAAAEVKPPKKAKAAKIGKVEPEQKGGESTANEGADSGKYVLLKNHGLLLNGRTHKFYGAGTEFDTVADAKLIAALINSGAKIEQQ